MRRREAIRVLGTTAAGVCALGVSSCPRTQQPTRPPNVVFLMADDMGYGDAHCFNPDSRIPTPKIDRLAREGMHFTHAHAPGALCVPSRYGLLTGRYPFRVDLGQMPLRPLIEADRMTIGAVFQRAGYRTACIGKWHLGFDTPHGWGGSTSPVRCTAGRWSAASTTSTDCTPRWTSRPTFTLKTTTRSRRRQSGLPRATPRAGPPSRARSGAGVASRPASTTRRCWAS